MRQYKRIFFAAAICVTAALTMGMNFHEGRTVKSTEVSVPQESAETLMNPECGVYHIYGYTAGSDGSGKADEIADRVRKDADASLCLIEINLKKFRSQDLTEDALSGIGDLLEGIGSTGKKMIVRVLYDWDGMAVRTEPDSFDLILRHMKELGPVLVRNKNSIYTMQGLFIGNWGEMNQSRYSDAEKLCTLKDTLEEATQHEIRLSVRTPVQWRTIEHVTKEDLTEQNIWKLSDQSLLGLFNDGLTGSATDYGTYADDLGGQYESRTSGTLQKIDLQSFNPLSKWPRDAELSFEGMISKVQPLGGEAIHAGEWNDLTQAIRSFRRMHLSYLNQDYDGSVWKKWASDKVSEDSVFDGMEGDDYIRTHLGYRFVLTDAMIKYHWLRNRISVSVDIKNRGFAPAYQNLSVQLGIFDADRHMVSAKTLQLNPESLSGGMESDQKVALSTDFSASNLESGAYTVELNLANEDGTSISLGNEGKRTDTEGRIWYPFGTVSSGG